MARASAKHASGRSGRTESGTIRRSSTVAPFRRPAGANEDGAPTIRNFIPWKDMERKLAERLAARAAAGELSDDVLKDSLDVPSNDPPSNDPPPEPSGDVEPAHVEPAPDSGVRSSVNSPVPDLTYSAYTVADLEARGQVRAPRMSMAFAPALPPPPSRWLDVRKTGVALALAAWSVVRAPKPRPRLLDVCRLPWQLFYAELKATLRTLPWRKLGAWAGVALGAMVVLLGVVLTVAELTDDLKPSRGSLSAGTSSVSAVMDPTSAEPPPGPAKTIELDDAPPPPRLPEATPAPVVKSAKKPPANLKKKKDVEVFIP